MTMNRADLIRQALLAAKSAFAQTLSQKESLDVQLASLRREIQALEVALQAQQQPSLPFDHAVSTTVSRVGPRRQVQSPTRRFTGGQVAAAAAGVLAGVGALAASSREAEKAEWEELSRTAAIERVFSEVRAPLHRSQLTDLLHQKGRDDDLRDVSAALAYLKRVRRAESLGQGRWFVRPPANGAEARDEEGSDAE